MSEWIDLDEMVEKSHATESFMKVARFFEYKVVKQVSFQKKIAEIRLAHRVTVTEDEEDWDFLTSKIDDELVEEVVPLCLRYKLPEYFIQIIVNYILHGEIKYLFDTQNALVNVKTTGSSDFPIILKISPYASERDVIDFVKKAFKTQIAPQLGVSKEKSKPIGTAKRRKNFKLSSDIYKEHLEGLTNMEIFRLHSDDEVDYANIGKIISLEEKERKEM